MTSGGQIALQIAARNSNTTILIDGLGDDVKSQREQLCGQATLGRFCLEPAFRVFRNAESRNGPVQATGSAELSRIMLRKNVARRTGTWWSSECYANTGASGIERVPDILTRHTLLTSNSLREAGGNVRTNAAAQSPMPDLTPAFASMPPLKLPVDHKPSGRRVSPRAHRASSGTSRTLLHPTP